MSSYTHPRLEVLFGIAEALGIAARELALHTVIRDATRRMRPRRGATVRPGADTPLWIALVTSVKPHLSRRGARALLARELGVHRARIGEYFDRRSAMPDAERALELLLWVARRTPIEARRRSRR